MYAPLITGLIMFCIAPTLASELPVMDDAGRDSSFLAFRERFSRAIEERDTVYLFNDAFDPDLVVNIDQISRDYLMDALAAGNERYWHEIALALSLGGDFTCDTIFVAPSLSAAWPPGSNPLEFKVVIGRDVPVFRAASTESDTLAMFSCETVRIIPNSGPVYGITQFRDWQEVRLEDGHSGFMEKSRLLSALDLRLGFVDTQWGWKLKYFVRGVEPPAHKVLILPLDETAQDSSFLEFHRRLTRAVQEKDTTYVFSILDPGIKFNFGWENGSAWFRKFWKFDQGIESGFWDEFGSVLALGGGFRGDDGFQAPYISIRWTRSTIGDAFNYTVALADAFLYEKPDTSTVPLRSLDYEILRYNPDNSNSTAGWFRVLTHDCLSGWVRKDRVRSPIDYRAGFKKENGRWILKHFVAGD